MSLLGCVPATCRREPSASGGSLLGLSLSNKRDVEASEILLDVTYHAGSMAEVELQQQAHSSNPLAAGGLFRNGGFRARPA